MLPSKRSDNLGSHITGAASSTCCGKARHLFLLVTSVVFDHPLSASDMAGEESDNIIISSHLICSIARAYIFGLSMHHCSKTFQLLSCGMSELISKAGHLRYYLLFSFI
ncbi:hypothetical protein TSMEX_003181 [Taenia solium]|eukprot:TsM_001232500 transcript=TsM_001232500 gene=TsM_001232500